MTTQPPTTPKESEVERLLGDGLWLLADGNQRGGLNVLDKAAKLMERQLEG